MTVTEQVSTTIAACGTFLGSAVGINYVWKRLAGGTSGNRTSENMELRMRAVESAIATLIERSQNAEEEREHLKRTMDAIFEHLRRISDDVARTIGMLEGSKRNR